MVIVLFQLLIDLSTRLLKKLLMNF